MKLRKAEVTPQILLEAGALVIVAILAVALFKVGSDSLGILTKGQKKVNIDQLKNIANQVYKLIKNKNKYAYTDLNIAGENVIYLGFNKNDKSTRIKDQNLRVKSNWFSSDTYKKQDIVVPKNRECLNFACLCAYNSKMFDNLIKKETEQIAKSEDYKIDCITIKGADFIRSTEDYSKSSLYFINQEMNNIKKTPAYFIFEDRGFQSLFAEKVNYKNKIHIIITLIDPSVDLNYRKNFMIRNIGLNVQFVLKSFKEDSSKGAVWAREFLKTNHEGEKKDVEDIAVISFELSRFILENELKKEDADRLKLSVETEELFHNILLSNNLDLKERAIPYLNNLDNLFSSVGWSWYKSEKNYEDWSNKLYNLLSNNNINSDLKFTSSKFLLKKIVSFNTINPRIIEDLSGETRNYKTYEKLTNELNKIHELLSSDVLDKVTEQQKFELQNLLLNLEIKSLSTKGFTNDKKGVADIFPSGELLKNEKFILTLKNFAELKNTVDDEYKTRNEVNNNIDSKYLDNLQIICERFSNIKSDNELILKFCPTKKDK